MSVRWDPLNALLLQTLLAFARLATLLLRTIHPLIHATAFQTNSKMHRVFAKPAQQIALLVILQVRALSARPLTLYRVPSAHVTPQKPTKPL